MNYKIKIPPLVEIEFDESIEWYELEVKGLGVEFAFAVNKTLKNIQSDPHRFPKTGRKGIRKCVLQRFPYIIFFNINESETTIRIISIFHASRHPAGWKKRI